MRLHTREQVCNADKSALFQMYMPTRTFILQEEKPIPGFKASKTNLLLFLPSGDMKIMRALSYVSPLLKFKGLQWLQKA